MSDSIIKTLMDRPIAFQRSFVRLGVGITGALMLSQAVYWSQRTSDREGWFYKTQEEWEDETGMTRYEQEGARKKLRKIGVLKEKREGIPSRLWYRIDYKALEAGLYQVAEIPHTRMQDGDTPNEAHGCQDGEIPHTGMGKTSKQARGNSAYSGGEIPHSTTETTTEITTETKPHSRTKNVRHDEGALNENDSQEKKPPVDPWDDDELLNEGFDIFHKAGMRKDQGRKAPFQKFSKLCKKKKQHPVDFAKHLAEDIRKKIEVGIIKSSCPGGLMPTTYLNQERWEGEVPTAPPCPHADILAAFDEAMPSHVRRPDAMIWKPGYDPYHDMAKLWRDGFYARKSNGEPFYKTTEDGLRFWGRAFAFAATSDFLMGQPWFELEWMLKGHNFIDILREKYHQRMRA